jgi:hypothetical protein
MKTMKEKALDFFEWRGGTFTDKDVKDLSLLLKIQDRDTRHACAEACLKATTNDNLEIVSKAYHDICMNLNIEDAS